MSDRYSQLVNLPVAGDLAKISDQDSNAAKAYRLAISTLDDVVTRYNVRRALGLTPQEVSDVAQYVKSL